MAPEFYWVNFAARPGGGEGSAEIGTRSPLSRGEQVAALQDDLARQIGAHSVVIRTFTHLRSEPDEGG